MNKPTGPSFLEKRPLGSTLVRSGGKAGIRNIQVLQQRAGISMLLRYGVATRGTHQDCSLDRRHYPLTAVQHRMPRYCHADVVVRSALSTASYSSPCFVAWQKAAESSRKK